MVCGRVSAPLCKLSDPYLLAIRLTEARGSVIGVPSSTAYILAYDHLLNVTLPPLVHSPILTPLLAGIIARSTVTTIVSPLELIRTNLQSTPPSPGKPNTLRSVFTNIRALVHHGGFVSLWRGLGPTLLRDVTFSGFYWASYESWKTALTRRGYKGVSVSFVSGAISGTLSALITSPFDVVKTRRQALIMSTTTSHTSSSFALLFKILQTEGPKALFAGLSPRIAKIAPACGIMISCFEVRVPHVSPHAFTNSTVIRVWVASCPRNPWSRVLLSGSIDLFN